MSSGYVGMFNNLCLHNRSAIIHADALTHMYGIHEVCSITTFAIFSDF